MNIQSTQQQLPSAPARQQTRHDHLSPAQPALTRSYSIGGTSALQSRNRRPVDDLESAYSSDVANQAKPSQQQQQASFYPPSITYATTGHQQYTQSSQMPPAMSQQEQYMIDSPYDPSPRQTQNSQRDSQMSNSTRKSDSYGNQSSMFGPNTYAGTTSYGTATTAQGTVEAGSKPSTPYISPHQQALPSSALYSPTTFTQSMEATQATPARRHQQSASQSHLAHHLTPQQSTYQMSNMSHSSSPVAYTNQQQQQRTQDQYYSPPIKDEPMQDILPSVRPASTSQLGYDLYSNVQVLSRGPSPMDHLTPRQRRLQGFRPVRDTRDLRPAVPQASAKRADPSRSGAFLNVSNSRLKWSLLIMAFSL